MHTRGHKAPIGRHRQHRTCGKRIPRQKNELGFGERINTTRCFKKRAEHVEPGFTRKREHIMRIEPATEKCLRGRRPDHSPDVVVLFENIVRQNNFAKKISVEGILPILCEAEISDVILHFEGEVLEPKLRGQAFEGWELYDRSFI